MAIGHGILSSRNLSMFIYIYLAFSSFSVTISSCNTRARLIHILRSSNLVNAVKIKGFGPPTRTTSATKPVSASSKAIAGLRLAYSVNLAIMLISLANDVEIQPGPPTKTSEFSKLPSSRGLKICHLNVRSLLRKLYEVKLLVQESPFDILTISETWLNKSISDSEVLLSGYSIVRSDRRAKKHGGDVAIYIKDGTLLRCIRDLETDNTETCWIEIIKPKAKKLYVCSVYRPPIFRLTPS